MNNEWQTFWKNSAEIANDALRKGSILANGEIKDLDDIFVDPFRYYIENLKIMNTEIKKNVISEEMTLFRTVFGDIYFDFDEGEIVNHRCFTSCYTNKYHHENGDISILVKIKQGTNYLSYDNVIILPPGKYCISGRTDDYYVLEFIEATEIFTEN